MSPPMGHQVFPLVYSTLYLVGHANLETEKNMVLGLYTGHFNVAPQNFVCCLGHKFTVASVKKEQTLTTRQIKHCLSHYPGILLPLSKAGSDNPGLIIVDLATAPH